MDITTNATRLSNNISKSFNNSIKAPNWDIIPSKSDVSISKSELNEQIKQLAEKSVKAKSQEEKDAVVYHRNKLLTAYLSPISPDRKALYRKANKVIQKHQEQVNKPILEELSLVNFLTKPKTHRTNKSEVGNIKSYFGDASLESAACTGGGYDYTISIGNNRVMSTDLGNWYYTPTQEELKKTQEFNRIFENYCNNNNYEREKEFQNSIDGIEHFDMKA